MTERRWGEVITFYSYKGGVGRSMALANAAVLLAQRGRRVLAIDFDIEAPGLHRYFLDPTSMAQRHEPVALQAGVVDFFHELRRRLDREFPDNEAYCSDPTGTEQFLAASVRALFESGDYTYRVQIADPNTDPPGSATVDLLPAGRFDGEYAERVHAFDWRSFYQEYAEVLPVFARSMAELYDYVLIDSRTGITDIGSICTAQLPGALVLVFAPNRQALEGVLEVGREAARIHHQVHGSPLLLYPLISRVEDAEDALKRHWIERALAGFAALYREEPSSSPFGQGDVVPSALKEYFARVRAPYRTYYAYGEQIAAERELVTETGGLAAALDVFVRVLDRDQPVADGASMTEAKRSKEDVQSRLARALDVPSAFPWQLSLLDRMLAGDLPGVIDVPTGLGKTAVVAIWLVARAAGASVPRRLVYVVDRRAVVDQATSVAEALRDFVEKEPELKAALGLEPHRPLPISTLRGQFLDNRAWLADPSTPAIVLGTVDMVGSRLLFEGYGVSRRMRPYHAGLLGADSLVVLDEAHLVPPFEHLIRTIARAADIGIGPREPALAELVPRLRLLSLSATGRANPGALTLSKADREHPIVARRLAATKELVLRTEVAAHELPERLADEAWTLTNSGMKPVRCIVFCNRRNDAQSVAAQLGSRAGKTIPIDIELFVGGRRVWERAVAADWLRAHGFLAGTTVALDRPAFVIATSAGEVGVDLDADHMVSDLVAWERMVQRLGRVNRRGDGAAIVVVVPTTDDDEVIALRLAAANETLKELPRTKGDAFDASPGALTELKERSATDERLSDLIARASTPEPLRPVLTRPLVEAWSMTSLEDHPGRPEVGPWLRGWIPEDEPKTTIVWREVLPIKRGDRLLSHADLEVFLASAGPQFAEHLETETSRAMAWLTARLGTLTESNTTAAPALPEQPRAPMEADARGAPTVATAWNDRPDAHPHKDEVVGVIVSGREPWAFLALDLSRKEKRAEIEARLRGATVLVDARIGGLARGLLHEESDVARDVTTLRGPGGEPALPIRVRRTHDHDRRDVDGGDALHESWRQEARIAIAHSDAGDEVEWLVAESLATAPAESEEGRAVGAKRAQKLDEHEEWAERAARRIARRLALPRPYADVLALAARLHDEGKKAKCWQQAFHAPRDGVYGKTCSRPNFQILAGYRHELGSLPHAERDDRVQALDDELRDLCLHLISAHHGNARPLIRTDGAEEPPSKLETRAQEIALRFARLEKRWGPWGLAWWEALLRAADQQASRQNDEGGANG